MRRMSITHHSLLFALYESPRINVLAVLSIRNFDNRTLNTERIHSTYTTTLTQKIVKIV